MYENFENQKMLDKIRDIKYHGLTETFDDLYEKAKEGKLFTNLYDLIISENNIMLAYKNLKKNAGSKTPGVNDATIDDIHKLTQEDMIQMVRQALKDYYPRPVRRVEIPKEGTDKTRPLGIPTIEDRLIQQCILQVLEPITEAVFNKHSHGFRPNRSCETAMAEVYKNIQRSDMFYAVSVDIQGFFDNVNHRKLMRQLWALGIRDTKLLMVIKRILKAPIVLPNGETVYPKKGTPQGGIISPLLANIVLNEFDWWIYSQWEGYAENQVEGIKPHYNPNGERNLSAEYKRLSKSNLKVVKAVRYADDIVIFTKTLDEAQRIKLATEDFLQNRLKLTCNPDKTKIVKLKKQYLNFLGFKVKAVKSGTKDIPVGRVTINKKRVMQHKTVNRYIVDCQMSDKAVIKASQKLKQKIKDIAKAPANKKIELIKSYNIIVVGIQNYYRIANNAIRSFDKIQNEVRKVMCNRLKVPKSSRNIHGDKEWYSEALKIRFKHSKQTRWIANTPIVSIAYCKSRHPQMARVNVCDYKPEGRIVEMRDYEKIARMILNPVKGQTAEYNSNRVYVYTMQKGLSGIKREPLSSLDAECHHKKPKELGGTDDFNNLIFLTYEEHKLIHATEMETIEHYMAIVKPNKRELAKINKLRQLAELKPIA